MNNWVMVTILLLLFGYLFPDSPLLQGAVNRLQLTQKLRIIMVTILLLLFAYIFLDSPLLQRFVNWLQSTQKLRIIIVLALVSNLLANRIAFKFVCLNIIFKYLFYCIIQVNSGHLLIVDSVIIFETSMILRIRNFQLFLRNFAL